MIPDHAFPLFQFSFLFTTPLTIVYKLHNNKHVCFHGFYYVTYVTGEKLKKGYLYISHFSWDHGYEGNKLQKLTNLQHESDIQCLFVYKIENLKPNSKLRSIDTIREGKRRPYIFKKHQSKLRILFVHARQSMQYLVNIFRKHIQIFHSSQKINLLMPLKTKYLFSYELDKLDIYVK